MSAKTDQFFETMTQKVADMLNQADAEGWDKPWVDLFDGGLPINAKTRKAYQGGNAIWLWLTASVKGYDSNEWATYKMWDALGAQVRKGEKGTQGVKWVIKFKCETCSPKLLPARCSNGHKNRKIVFPSVFTLFNAAQVDGYEAPEVVRPTNVVERKDAIEALVEASGANVTFNGNSAHYVPGTDNITLPPVEAFKSTEGFYATLLHEVTHFTGDKSRLDRDQRNPFGSEKYAAEELVAELGSVFLQAHFGLNPEPSANSAKYIKGWLRVLAADSQNVWRAASLAQKATNWLVEQAEVDTPADSEEAADAA